MKSRTRVVRRSVSKNVSTAVQTNRLFSVRLHVYFFTRAVYLTIIFLIKQTLPYWHNHVIKFLFIIKLIYYKKLF